MPATTPDRVSALRPLWRDLTKGGLFGLVVAASFGSGYLLVQIDRSLVLLCHRILARAC